MLKLLFELSQASIETHSINRLNILYIALLWMRLVVEENDMKFVLNLILLYNMGRGYCLLKVFSLVSIVLHNIYMRTKSLLPFKDGNSLHNG